MVARRRNEIGIRLALGAGARTSGGHGDAGGRAAAGHRHRRGRRRCRWLAGRGAGSLLFGLKPYDPVTLVGAALLLALIACAASFLPARRASKLDPMSRAARRVVWGTVKNLPWGRPSFFVVCRIFSSLASFAVLDRPGGLSYSPYSFWALPRSTILASSRALSREISRSRNMLSSAITKASRPLCDAIQPDSSHPISSE